MMSCGKWAPLKLIILSPSSSWVSIEGEHTMNAPRMKVCDKNPHDPLCVRCWLALPSPEGFHLVRKLARPCPHVFVGSVERRRVIAQALTHRDCHQLLQVDIFVVG